MDSTLTDYAIRARFGETGDFIARELTCGGQKIYAYMIDGLIAGATASETVFRPLARMENDTMEGLYLKAV